MSAREHGQPKGDPVNGYDPLLPLDRNSRLDPIEWQTHPYLCQIRHFRENNDSSYGYLRCKKNGQWFIEYPDGPWCDKHFVEEEYLSIKSGETMLTYRIDLVERP